MSLDPVSCCEKPGRRKARNPPYKNMHDPIRVAVAAWDGYIEPCVIDAAAEYRASGRSPLHASLACPWVGQDAYLLNLLIEATRANVSFVFYGENNTDFSWAGHDIATDEWSGLLSEVLPPNGTIDLIGSTYGLSWFGERDWTKFTVLYPVGPKD